MKRILNAIRNIGITSGLLIFVIFTLLFTGLKFYQTPKQIFAFPSAQGAGAFTQGGRGGAVYHIKTLKDTNELGSLRYAINQKGQRTIIFDVSGDIELKQPLIINNGNLTIAGQTANLKGICLKNHPLIINANNVIVRFISIKSNSDNGLIIKDSSDIMIDHCSISDSATNVSMYNNQNLTMQWCLISNAKIKNINGGIGGILGGYNTTYHHNLFANNKDANPKFFDNVTSGKSNNQIDFRNNVIYGWQTSSLEGMAGNYNIINNYFKFNQFTNIAVRSQILYLRNSNMKNVAYVRGNFIERYPLQSNDNFMGVYPNLLYIKESKNPSLTYFEFGHDFVGLHSAKTAFKKILKSVGSSIARSDSDKDIIDLIEHEYYDTAKIVQDDEKQVALVDSDGDGIPDEWEFSHKLNPYDSGDAKNLTQNGYTNLEIYLNQICDKMVKNQNAGIIFNRDYFNILFQQLVNTLK